jgi:hypothetical protein
MLHSILTEPPCLPPLTQMPPGAEFDALVGGVVETATRAYWLLLSPRFGPPCLLPRPHEVSLLLQQARDVAAGSAASQHLHAARLFKSVESPNGEGGARLRAAVSELGPGAQVRFNRTLDAASKALVELAEVRTFGPALGRHPPHIRKNQSHTPLRPM